MNEAKDILSLIEILKKKMKGYMRKHKLEVFEVMKANSNLELLEIMENAIKEKYDIEAEGSSSEEEIKKERNQKKKFWLKYINANEIEQIKMIRSLQIMNNKTIFDNKIDKTPRKDMLSSLLKSYIDDIIEVLGGIKKKENFRDL